MSNDVVEVCFVFVNSSGRIVGVNDDGKRVVYRMSVENVRKRIMYFMRKRMLIEFIGCGWRCVWENGKYWWSKVRELENYVDDLCVDG